MFFEGCEEENDQPPPLEKVEAAICDDEDLGGLGEALLKQIAEAVQVQRAQEPDQITKIG